MTRWNTMLDRNEASDFSDPGCPHHAARAVDLTPQADRASSSLAFADFLEECCVSLSESLELVRSAYRERSAPEHASSAAIRASRN